jgi:hypothetical protein
MMNRRTFVRIVPTFGAFAMSVPAAEAQQSGPYSWPSAPSAADAPSQESFPSHHPFLAKEMVGVAHSNIARVKALLSAQPALANASWDWGYGDWETAIGAASHVGNRAIAELLFQHGASPSIFSAAMLGQIDVVKGFASVIANVNQLRGPHGIPLINHARAGGAQAADVVKYLESLGNVPKPGDLEPMSAADRMSLVGRYVFGNGPRDAFIVDAEKNTSAITRVGASRRLLTHLGSLTFHPVGTPSVRIRFEMRETDAMLSLFDPELIVRARRAE